KLAVADVLQKQPEKTARDVSIACFGLAFKANIDDLRESPAIAIAQQVVASHPGRVLVVEPNIEELPEKFSVNLTLASADSAMQVADVVVLLVDHKEFREIIPHPRQLVVDTRGLWEA
ncbi:UDP binding domain-containing protein, partial [Pseudomonas aeruginosa]